MANIFDGISFAQALGALGSGLTSGYQGAQAAGERRQRQQAQDAQEAALRDAQLGLIQSQMERNNRPPVVRPVPAPRAVLPPRPPSPLQLADALDKGYTAIGNLPPAAQPGFARDFNRIGVGTLPVPGEVSGSQPMNYGLPPQQAGPVNAAIGEAQALALGLGGMGVPGLSEVAGSLGGLLVPQKPTYTPTYGPTRTDQATINGKAAAADHEKALTTSLAQNYGLRAEQFKDAQGYRRALTAARQRELDLRARGLSEQQAHDRAMEGIASQNAGTSRLRLRGGPARGGGNGTAADGLHARLFQRMTALTAPGKADLYGTPGKPLVTLDKDGNPSGPGAQEYRQLLGLTHSAGGQGSGPPSAAGNDTVIVNGRHVSRAWVQRELQKRGGR